MPEDKISTMDKVKLIMARRSKLYLSTDPYYLERSRTKGERDLERLVDTAKLEGCWLFDADESIWYNIGYRNEKISEEGTVSSGVVAYRIDLSQIRQASHYHIHPKIEEDELKKELRVNIRTLWGALKSKMVTNYTSLALALPSDGDVFTYSKILQENQNASIDFRIMSPRGMTIVNFNEVKEPETARQRYLEARLSKQLTEIAYRATNPRDSIFQGIDYINEAMKQIFTMRFKYRV